jgi:serine/threonine-protein kinase
MLTEGLFLAERYEIVGKIGAGGMSDVYKAKDHTLGRFVAVKVLKQEFSEDVNFVTKFRTEAQSAAGLEHPNIVNIYDVGSENGIHYIIMECVEGITLKTYIEKKGQLSFKEAISIAIQVGRGIEAAHNKQIIHRDIKPQNIIISTEGKVKVTDFGIAHAVNNNTIHSDVMGSVHYASPEQARNGFVDGKSDIYSLGIVMYEMVTGKVPFDGDTTVSIAIQHLQEDIIPPSVYAETIPISIEKIILKSTQKSPDRRYDSISDLLLDLKKALISPNEDFVVMVPAGADNKTRVIPADEVAAIKEANNNSNREPLDERENDDEEEEDIADQEEDEEEDDDDDEGILNPKMEKAVTILGIIAAVIILAIVVYIVGNVTGLFKFNSSEDDSSKVENSVDENKEKQTDTSKDPDETDEPIVETVVMIDILNMTLEEATNALSSLELTVEEKERVASDEIKEGHIMSQSVPEGDEVEKASVIQVTISSGLEEFEAPEVVGELDEPAKKIIEDYGLTPSRDYNSSDTVPEGTVMSQEPSAGTPVKKGDTIHYIVSTGQQEVQVPDVRNHTEEEAKSAITNAKLLVGRVDSSESESVEAGRVISQSEAPSSFVTPGSYIDLVISTGKKTEYYSYSSVITEPDDKEPHETYVAYVKLFKADTDEQIQINNKDELKLEQFPATIQAVNIKDSSEGRLEIRWEMSVTDENGVPQITQLPVDEKIVQFNLD